MTPLTDTQLDEIAARAASLYEYATLDDELLQDEADRLTGTDVPALLDEVRRLRAERDEFCNRVDTLTAVATGNKRHVQEMLLELQKAQAALEAIRHLHKDSPMGPCPVCIDADAAAAGGDGLVPYPCPTGRLAGAQDCDPPSVRAAVALRETVHGCPPDGSGVTPCCGRTPFELPRTDRMATDPAHVTCDAAVSSG